jgi:hypothetical protein
MHTTEKKQRMARDRERLIKEDRHEKTGFVCSSRIPTPEWYKNYDRTFKKEK